MKQPSLIVTPDYYSLYSIEAARDACYPFAIIEYEDLFIVMTVWRSNRHHEVTTIPWALAGALLSPEVLERCPR